MAFTEDLSVFLNDEEFAVNATLKGGSTVAGIFDNGFQSVLDMEGVKPSFTCIATQVSNLKNRSRLSINGDEYAIASKEPDGTGLIILYLEKT